MIFIDGYIYLFFGAVGAEKQIDITINKYLIDTFKLPMNKYKYLLIFSFHIY